jgi:hypothetical protein
MCYITSTFHFAIFFLIVSWISSLVVDEYLDRTLTLILLTTAIVAPPSNASKWKIGFNSAFKGLKQAVDGFRGPFQFAVNPLTPELNPSAQRCLPRFLIGNVVS